MTKDTKIQSVLLKFTEEEFRQLNQLYIEYLTKNALIPRNAFMKLVLLSGIKKPNHC